MRCIRHAEPTILGYRIERIDEYDERGLLQAMRYEVFCPQTGATLGSHASLRAARKHVILHELHAARALRQRRQERQPQVA